jgi:hypothetical protein
MTYEERLAKSKMKEAVEDILETLSDFEDDDGALTAAYTVVAYTILACYRPDQWGERLAYVQGRLPVVFKGLIDEFNRQNGHTAQPRGVTQQ